MKKTMQLILYRWTKIGIFSTLLFSILAYWGNWFRYIELLTHFRLQYFVFSCFALLLLMLKRYWKWSFIAITSIFINAIEIIPWYYSSTSQYLVSQKIIGKPLRLLHANVYTQNNQYSKLIKLINKEKPDLVFLQETDIKWLKALKTIKTEFPYQISIPRSDNFGIALYSRVPFVKSDIIEEFSPSFIPSIYIEIERQNKIVSILSTHPLPPIGDSYFNERNEQLLRVSNFLNKIPHEKIVIGDLNLTMWSPYFTKFITNTGLINVRKGFGVLASWPTSLPFLKIPLDHCLVGEGIKTIGVKLGDNIGSDHLPLVVDLILE